MPLSVRKTLITLIAIGSFAGCLDKESNRDIMCHEEADCSGSQICDEGICWGNPPDTSRFAVILIPPADRSDLAPTELRDIEITPDGTIVGLEFAPSVTVHGRIVLACDAARAMPCANAPLVPAQVIIEREAGFEGGPLYQRTTLTNIEVAPEEDSFSMKIPKDGAQYRVTVLADQTSLDSQAAGDTSFQVPPFSTTINASSDTLVTWEIGRPNDLKSMEGCITSTTGNGSNFAQMHVSALGKWSADGPLTRASSVVMTDASGCFSLTVPKGMRNEFDIVAKPGPAMTLPTLRLSGEVVPDPLAGEDDRAHQIAPLIMPNAANPVTFKLPIMGPASGGSLEPVSGATLYFSTVFDKTEGEMRDVEVRFTAQVTSNAITDIEPGVATVALYPGSVDNNRSYQIQVIAPPDSQLASSFNTSLTVGTGSGAPVLSSIDLSRRVAVTGTIVRDDQRALANTPISVRPSPLLRQELSDSEARTVLDNLQFPSLLTGEEGDFLLWLDPELLGQRARYDLELSPSNYSSAPRWTFTDLSLTQANNRSAVDVGQLRLPSASYARGEVRDEGGRLTPGAEIRWYQLPAADACARVGLPSECSPPAALIGIWESDVTGKITAVLPDP